MAKRYCVVEIPISGVVVVQVEVESEDSPSAQQAVGVNYLDTVIKPGIDAMLAGATMPGVQRFDWRQSGGGYSSIMGSLVEV